MKTPPEKVMITNYNDTYENFKAQGRMPQFFSRMNQTSVAISMQLKNHAIWKNVHTFADVGGNNGYTALRICKE